MGTIINFKCENCDFNFQDKDLIFYLDKNDNLKEETLHPENSNLMSKSLLEGFLYESYCPYCNRIIKTYVPEMKNISLSKEEIMKILKEYNEKDNFKVLIFDFNITTYKDRREILERNECPNCKKNISLILSEKTPCPKCGSSLKEQ